MAVDEMENVDNVILSRISLKDISVLSEDDPDDTTQKKSPLTTDEREWRLSYLRSQFESYQLHDLFKIYTRKVDHGYFSLFLILQILLTLFHSIFVIYRNRTTLFAVLPDLILYIITIILSAICLYLVDKVAEKYKKLHYVSILAFGILFFVNGFVPYYHRYEATYRPAYSAYLTIACYLFFAVENMIISTSMGIMVSVFHIVTLYCVTYSNDGVIWEKIMSDVVFAVFMNCLGIYYRYMNEIVIRRSFLDRRDCIMSTFQLKHEKIQVDQLMQSIIPNYVINKVKERYIEATKYFSQTGRIKQSPFGDSLLDEHENVSILFADIVNYTDMTGKLKITSLLETLNDLFGLFDDVSEKLKVSRIKFLGDCYYCVAGLPPNKASNPSEACVDLGIEMIAIIDKVRRKKSLNIDMRIGVHSGRILSGIIGSVKYQFDIWSKDVDIANKMESEGTAGMVHITNKTKELLRKHYNIEPTNKHETVPQFKANGIRTYLIKPLQTEKEALTPTSESCPTTPTGTISELRKQRSFPNGILLNQLQRMSIINEENPDKNILFIEESRYRNSDDRIYRKGKTNRYENRRSTSAWKRRTAFMNNNIKRYNERAQDVNTEMERAIDSISFSKYQQYTKVKEINFLVLFNDIKTELEYLQIPDALFKYYLLGASSLILCVYIIQNLTLKRWDLTTWSFLATLLPIIFILIPISWTQYLYNKYVATYSNEIPNNLVMKFLYSASSIMTDNFYVRLCTFLLVYFLFSACVMTEMIDCRSSLQNELGFNQTKTNLLLLLFSNQIGAERMLECVLPWHMTETCAMTVIMTFLFLRVFIWIKLLLGTVVIGLYAYCVLSFSKGYYMNSETFNQNLEPPVAHIMSTVFLIITLHLVDRQTDYMNRLDYLLNRRFKSEQAEANLLQKVNEHLLINILPKHVANLYLDVNREQKELYFEEHNNVAVMFASIITEDELQDILDEKEFLSLMNTYITKFDILTNREQYHSIEKIKVAKWTYMVACGLFAGVRVWGNERHQTSSTMSTLLNFATDMFKTLNQANKNNQQQTKLRIGICHGDIAAGVVGSKKPLYDIWGDAVNMASRMDSTGIPGKIQVMEDTAEVIQHLGYKCTQRGNIVVKGKAGLIKTYFVDIDEHYNLVKYHL